MQVLSSHSFSAALLLERVPCKFNSICLSDASVIRSKIMKPTFRLLALPCCLTLIGAFLPLSSLQAKDAAEKPKAKATEKAKPAPAKEAEVEAPEEEEATAEDFILANVGVLENMEAAATLLDSVKDVKTAKIATAKLKKLSVELKLAFDELNDLGVPNEEVTTELEKEKKLPVRAAKVAAHFKESTEALTALEDKAALQTIAATLQEYGTIAKTAGKGEEPEPEPEDEAKTPATLAEATKLSTSILDNMEHAAEILEGITDADTAKEAAPELDEATAELKAIVKQIKGMGELGPGDKKKMDTNPKLAARGQKVGTRFQAAAEGLSKLEDKSAAAVIAPSLMSYGKAAQSLSGK